ncbi:thioredoxin H-type-like [Manihot esculenta]|uniref:thioredoxin H-type-like n=1 Tax=Manihot esculenta TaxID=3983 RepID=UPI001CC3D1F1|nr:thioredoxin H-type-like [Manihot esculenta]
MVSVTNEGTLTSSKRAIGCLKGGGLTEQFEKAKRGKQLIVVDLSASWCLPSRSMSPILAALVKEMPYVTFLMVVVDELRSVAMDCAVEAMPTFLFLKRGVLLDKVVGAM